MFNFSLPNRNTRGSVAGTSLAFSQIPLHPSHGLKDGFFLSEFGLLQSPFSNKTKGTLLKNEKLPVVLAVSFIVFDVFHVTFGMRAVC